MILTMGRWHSIQLAAHDKKRLVCSKKPQAVASSPRHPHSLNCVPQMWRTSLVSIPLTLFSNRSFSLNTCESWEYQFWGIWNQRITNGVHAHLKVCWLSFLMQVVFYTYFVFFTINYRIMMLSEHYKRFAIGFFEGISFFSGSNAYSLTFLFFFIFKNQHQKAIRDRKCVKKVIYWILKMVYLPLWLSFMTLSFIYCSFCQMLGIFLLVQWGSVLGTVILIAILVSSNDENLVRNIQMNSTSLLSSI